jgi:multiple sugar transport system permease protein/sn-glycerol 3-phosphate transport system permease protein
MVTVLVFSVWQLTGYTMIIYSAALSGIPPSYYEAAALDGAGPVRRFLRISVPLVAPTTGFLAVTGVVSSLQVFTQVYVLTQGGPLQSTQTILYWIYQQGFVLFDGGSASAGAVMLLLIGILLSVIQIRIMGRRDVAELA